MTSGWCWNHYHRNSLQNCLSFSFFFSLCRLFLTGEEEVTTFFSIEFLLVKLLIFSPVLRKFLCQCLFYYVAHFSFTRLHSRLHFGFSYLGGYLITPPFQLSRGWSSNKCWCLVVPKIIEWYIFVCVSVYLTHTHT